MTDLVHAVCLKATRLISHVFSLALQYLGGVKEVTQACMYQLTGVQKAKVSTSKISLATVF